MHGLTKLWLQKQVDGGSAGPQAICWLLLVLVLVLPVLHRTLPQRQLLLLLVAICCWHICCWPMRWLLHLLWWSGCQARLLYLHQRCRVSQQATSSSQSCLNPHKQREECCYEYLHEFEGNLP